MPATTGLGLLAILVVPAMVKPQSVGFWGFSATVAGYLLILACSQWFAPDARTPADTARNPGQLKRAALTGSVALVATLVMPLAIPGFDQGTFPQGSRAEPVGHLHRPESHDHAGKQPARARRNRTDHLRHQRGRPAVPAVRHGGQFRRRLLGTGRPRRDRGGPWPDRSRPATRSSPTSSSARSPRWTRARSPARTSAALRPGIDPGPERALDMGPRHPQRQGSRHQLAEPGVHCGLLRAPAHGQPARPFVSRTCRASRTISPAFPATCLTSSGTTADSVTGSSGTAYCKGRWPSRSTCGQAEFTYSLQSPVQGGYDGNGLSVLADFLAQKADTVSTTPRRWRSWPGWKAFPAGSPSATPPDG